MNNPEVIASFSNWLIDIKKLSNSTAKNYVNGVKNAGKYNEQVKSPLFDYNDEMIATINSILENPLFVKDDKTLHRYMSCALKQYAEFLTS